MMCVQKRYESNSVLRMRQADHYEWDCKIVRNGRLRCVCQVLV